VTEKQSDAELHYIWQCKEHRECYGHSHILLSEVRRVAARHDESCECWRHAVIRYVDSAELPLPLRRSPFGEHVKSLREKMGLEETGA
jgi:hypothetical protein